MVVLGVDPSTRTGVVALNEQIKVVEAKELFMKGEFECKIDRCIGLADQLVGVIEETKPSLIVFEAYAYQNQYTLATLVEIGTMFRVMARMLKIEYVEIAPSTLKKVATGSGRANKDHVMLEVYKRWGFSSKTNNISDAFVLAVVGLHLRGVDVGLPKANTTSLSKYKASQPPKECQNAEAEV